MPKELKGYYKTGYPNHFLSDDGVKLEDNYHTVKNFEEPYMVRPERRPPIELESEDGYNAIASEDPHQYHQMPVGANWEYAPRDGMISYRHRAIAVVDFDTYCEPRLLEVKLINA